MPLSSGFDLAGMLTHTHTSTLNLMTFPVIVIRRKGQFCCNDFAVVSPVFYKKELNSIDATDCKEARDSNMPQSSFAILHNKCLNIQHINNVIFFNKYYTVIMIVIRRKLIVLKTKWIRVKLNMSSLQLVVAVSNWLHSAAITDLLAQTDVAPCTATCTFPISSSFFWRNHFFAFILHWSSLSRRSDWYGTVRHSPQLKMLSATKGRSC